MQSDELWDFNACGLPETLKQLSRHWCNIDINISSPIQAVGQVKQAYFGIGINITTDSLISSVTLGMCRLGQPCTLLFALCGSVFQRRKRDASVHPHELEPTKSSLPGSLDRVCSGGWRGCRNLSFSTEIPGNDLDQLFGNGQISFTLLARTRHMILGPLDGLTVLYILPVWNAKYSMWPATDEKCPLSIAKYLVFFR